MLPNTLDDYLDFAYLNPAIEKIWFINQPVDKLDKFLHNVNVDKIEINGFPVNGGKIMIFDRIRQARLVARLTLDETVNLLLDTGVPLTKSALSNYERGKRNPKPQILMQLAKLYKVKPSYFLSEPSINVDLIAFRCQTGLSKKRRDEILAYTQNYAEKRVYLHETLYPNQKISFLSTIKVNSESGVEDAALKLRKYWNLGIAPIESLTQTIEDHGGMVVEYFSENIKFDGLSGWVNKKFPVLVVNSEIPDDRKRFDLAHELGHLVMNCKNLSTKAEEKLAYRFAGAFLIPKESIFADLGKTRNSISIRELGLLKEKYGASMQACLRRALDLGIINDSHYKRMNIIFSKNKWRRNEPFNFYGNESPCRLNQMTFHALSEGIITPSKAEELVPGASRAVAKPTDNNSEKYLIDNLMKLSRIERTKLLQRIMIVAEKEYRENQELKKLQFISEDNCNE